MTRNLSDENLRELIAIQDRLLQQVRNITRFVETRRLTGISRKEFLGDVTDVAHRFARVPYEPKNPPQERKS